MVDAPGRGGGSTGGSGNDGANAKEDGVTQSATSCGLALSFFDDAIVFVLMLWGSLVEY